MLVKKFSLYVITCIFFLILDFIWLGLIAKPIYLHYYGNLLRLHNNTLSPLWWAAILVYLLLVLGIVVLVLPQAKRSVLAAFLYGALYGLIVYSVYNLTNLAVLANWPQPIVLFDILWGLVVCSLTSGLAMLIKKLIL